MLGRGELVHRLHSRGLRPGRSVRSMPTPAEIPVWGLPEAGPRGASAYGAGGLPFGQGGRARKARGSASGSWPHSYALDDARVVAIGTYPKYASLFFFRGRELDAGSGVLEGAGKALRHFKLRAAGTPSART